GAPLPRPTAVNSTRAINRLGTVVQVMCRMWAKRSLPAAAGAILVVSERGEILSPNYAPEITAPAVIAGDMSRPCATPIKATPRAPATVHELPIASATMAQIRQAAG